MKNIKSWLAIWFLFSLGGIIHGQDAPELTRQTSGETHQAPSSYTFYSPDKEPPLKQKNAKPLRLVPSPRMKGVALVDYAMQVTIDTDKRIMDGGASSDGGGWASKSEGGFTKHIPRIKITAKNNSVPESSLLVIEYFSSQVLDKSNTNTRKECVEHISLPHIVKGESATVDANGVEFYKYEHKAGGYGYNFKRGEGLEFYGVIVSLFIDSELIIQMCSSSTLNKVCTDTIPPPQQYEDPHWRYYRNYQKPQP